MPKSKPKPKRKVKLKPKAKPKAKPKPRKVGSVRRRARRGAAQGGPRPAARRASRRSGPEPLHDFSATAVAAEALRSGVVPHAIRPRTDDRAIPGEAEAIRVGDPDDMALSNEYVGEDTPGGSTPTPDQSNVDEIGRIYGLQDEDSGELRTSGELMDRRDRRRRGGTARRPD